MFSLEIPTKIYFGRHCLQDALEKEKSLLAGKRVLLVTTGRSLRRLGYVDQVEAELKRYAGEVYVFEQVSANPRLSEVKLGTKLGQEQQVEVIVGFGGGSALDAAKGIAAGIPGDVSLDDMFFHGVEPSVQALPVIAIPTTAGTGSELSKGAIISDEEHQVKGGIRGSNIYPKVAIVDSYFTEQVPLQITLETGFDVFAHAVESLVSKKANAFSEKLSYEVIEIVAENLLRLQKNLADIEAREKMAYASMIMGINLGNVGTALPHRLQYPVGALSDTSHAAGLLALYPAWSRMEYKVSADKLDVVADILRNRAGVEAESMDAIAAFVERLGIRKSIQELCNGMADVDDLTARVSGSLENDPLYRDKNTVLEIYRASM